MKIAMIGAGGFANRHLQALRSIESTEVVAHVARSSGTAEAAAQRWGGTAYTGCESMLENEQPDAAWITVPPGSHGAIEELLISAGVPFFVEKPLAADRETPERIHSLLRDHDVIAGVGYHWRALDTLVAVREVLRETPAQMVIATWHGNTPPPAWWHRRSESGGQMVEQATHVIDLARHLVGDATVLAASAVPYQSTQYSDVDVDGASTATLAFNSGAIGTVTATCVLPRTISAGLEIICDGVDIHVRQEAVSYDFGHEHREERVKADPIVTENRAFIEAVKSHDSSKLYCDYEDALRTHRLTMDIVDKTG